MLLNMFKMLLDKRFSQHSSANHVLSTLLSALFGPYVKIISLDTINLLRVPLGLCRAPSSFAHLCTHLLQASSDLACDSFRFLGLHKPLEEAWDWSIKWKWYTPLDHVSIVAHQSRTFHVAKCFLTKLRKRGQADKALTFRHVSCTAKDLIK